MATGCYHLPAIFSWPSRRTSQSPRGPPLEGPQGVWFQWKNHGKIMEEKPRGPFFNGGLVR